MISVVIPTLNTDKTLQATFDCLNGGQNDDSNAGACEIIVVDGGSSDATTALVKTEGAVLVNAPCGRGGQLAAGAAVAAGDWLLFLHGDTRLEDSWLKEVRAFCQNPINAEKAGVFRFRLNDGSCKARILEHAVYWRCRIFALPYGDQGLFMSRTLYNRIGGFRPLVLMEDVDIVRRLGRRRLHYFRTAAITSAARYRKDGYFLRPIRNLVCLALYFLGVSTARIARIYQR